MILTWSRAHCICIVLVCFVVLCIPSMTIFSIIWYWLLFKFKCPSIAGSSRKNEKHWVWFYELHSKLTSKPRMEADSWPGWRTVARPPYWRSLSTPEAVLETTFSSCICYVTGPTKQSFECSREQEHWKAVKKYRYEVPINMHPIT